MVLFKQKEQLSQFNDKKIVDHLRALGIDMIGEAKSGHPGIVLGAAPILYTLFAKHLKVNPKDPSWFNRDRFVMSAGHGSALLYATLFMAGYDITLDDLKNFRKFDSITPGHPEYLVTPGVDMSTGPLGQGLASAVGMAIAEEYLRAYFIEKSHDIIDYHTYAFVGDGDLMEGVSYEAASLAGTLKLSKLIVLYDSNQTTLDGSTSDTFTENIADRFVSMGWNVLAVDDGENLSLIDAAIEKAKEKKDGPTLIKISTTIGKYSKYAGTSKVHGSPLEEDDVLEIKQKLDVREIPFVISKEAVTDFQTILLERVSDVYEESQKKIEKLTGETLELYEKLLNFDFSIKMTGIDYETPEDHRESTRVTSSKILNSLSKNAPFLIGGSADVSSSTKVYLDGEKNFSCQNRLGKNILFGVREHAMGSIANGLALSGLRPFVSTFLVFSDYMRPSIRLAAEMNLPVVYIFSHDSVTTGEDGPSHQPVEQLISLRTIPNVEVYRPADANEVMGCYKAIFAKKEGPSVLVLGRNDVPILDGTSVNDVSKGAYIVRKENKDLSGVLFATGEEVSLAINVANKLSEKGIELRVVSMVSVNRFDSQDESYIENIVPGGVMTFSIEAGSKYSWYPFVNSKDRIFSIDTFGKSASKEDILSYFEFDAQKIAIKIEELLK